MNESINLPKLISLIAQSAECSPAMARRFLHGFFALIETTLQQGGSVTIKGVGEFVRTDSQSNPIKFLADKELAAVANEPYAAFEAVELNEGVDENVLSEANETDETIATATITPSIETAITPIPEVANTLEPVEIEQAEEPQIEPEQNVSEAEPVQESAIEIFELKPDTDEIYTTSPEHESNTVREIEYIENSDETDNVPPPSNNKMWLLIGILIGLLIGLVGGFFAGKILSQYTGTEDIIAEADSIRNYVNETYNVPDSTINTDTLSTDTIVTEQPAPQPDTISEPKGVYDKLSTTLTRLSIKHYHEKDYWVFIFKANPNLKDPDRIAPGTRIFIPDRSTFECSTKAETIAKAKQLINDIYSNRK